MSYNYIGLDFETSGTTHDRHVPIQIGLALSTGEVFNSLIGGWRWQTEAFAQEGKHEWSAEAEMIHKITQTQLADAPWPDEVDDALVTWLEDHAGTGTKIMVGWNVGSFDRPFMQRWLPESNRMFIRRTLDLNAACYLLDRKGERNPDTLKSQAKRFANDKMQEGGSRAFRHDAAYDAQCALYELEYLRRML